MSDPHPVFKRWFYVLWHKITSSRVSVKRFLFNLLLLLLWFLAFIYPPLISGKIGFAIGISATVAYIVYGLLKSFLDTNSPGRTHFLKRKIARKIMTATVLDEMLTHTNPPETKAIETLENILDIIADHVRAFRLDRQGEKIFCSLLIEQDEDHLKVIARNKSGRKSSPLKKKLEMQAWTTMSTVKTIESGDILKDFPAGPANLPYKSVLTIPIANNNKAVAVLSIDSSEPYHFTGEEEKISTSLMPYLVLIKTVLLRSAIIQPGGLKKNE